MNDAMQKYWKKKSAITEMEMCIHDAIANANDLIKEHGMSIEEVNNLIADAQAKACMFMSIPDKELKFIKFKGLPKSEHSEELSDGDCPWK